MFVLFFLANCVSQIEVTFQSPPSMEVSITLPHAGTVTGMGITRGVSVIVGGGFHGKSAWAAQAASDISCHNNFREEEQV